MLLKKAMAVTDNKQQQTGRLVCQEDMGVCAVKRSSSDGDTFSPHLGAPGGDLVIQYTLQDNTDTTAENYRQ